MTGIAIVGRGCVLPGALDPTAFQASLLAGSDLTSRVPFGRWGVERTTPAPVPPFGAPDLPWTDRGGYVHGFQDAFEPSQHAPGLDPAQVMALDPLFQWTFYAAGQALREAGHEGQCSRAGAVMGNLGFPSALQARFAASVLLGRSEGLSEQLGPRPAASNRFISGLPAHLLARAHGLGAGAFALDAACASSLYAIRIAMDRLRSNEVDLMVAGAVSACDDLFIRLGFCALNALSPSGRSRPFAENADGLLPAEGAVFFALKRLEDAQAAGDTIFGVLREVSLGNDGRTRGMLAPSSEGQVRVMRQAYERSGWQPSDVGYVECHATGTPVGDATELRSLSAVFDELPLTIGSTKGNLGHCMTAAGGVALLKVLGAFDSGRIPGTLHLDEPTSALAPTRFRVSDEAQPWRGPGRAGINAFGFGGNNAHLLVEHEAEVPARRRRPPIQVEPIVVVGQAVRLGDLGTAAFVDAVHSGDPVALEATSIGLDLTGLGASPRDLEQALPQQLMVLEVVRELLASVDFHHERTGAFIGMGTDPMIGRYGVRWSLPDLGAEDAAWVRDAQDATVPHLTAAGVIGVMPNVVANRISVARDLRGPTFTVAAEEASGIRAIEVASQQLRAQDIDFAVAGAVDLSCETVHRAAADALLADRPAPADGAVVMGLMRQSDALAAGIPVLAVLTSGQAGQRFSPRRQLGHPHAAAGLLQLAAALVAAPLDEETRVSIDTLGRPPTSIGLIRRSTAALPAPYTPGQVVPAHWPEPDLPTRSTYAPVLRALADQQRQLVAEAQARTVALLSVLQQQFEAVMAASPRHLPVALPLALPSAPDQRYPGPSFTRAQLEVHATGKVSDVFGRDFADQDVHDQQCRMPAPPLLLTDRVLGTDAPPMVLGTGKMWTQTDLEDRWFLRQDGRVPPGLMIEAGQADLLLISWMGIDVLHNRGQRVYRLLGCDLTYRSALPRRGDTMDYAIGIDGHARQGDVHLFFFHYDCTVRGRPALSVRNGQAGFFSDADLLASGGILWSPEEAEPDETLHCDPPRLRPPSHLPREALLAVAGGDAHAAFGAGYEALSTHRRTPSIQGPPMLFLDRVTHLDPSGGPWKRGYLRAELDIHADAWFFDGHFKNDPCMPGTLMLEGCLQAMSLYLIALGFTFDHDSKRFEPVLDHTVRLRCRGQTVPSSRLLVCELFVESVIDGETPTLYADLLGTVDGLKSFHARRLGIRLVP